MQSISDSIDAVNTAAGKLHDLANQQYQVQLFFTTFLGGYIVV